MQTLRNTFNRLWAALMFFTRLPWWRIHQPKAEAFRHVVEYWPIVGWLSGGAMMLVYSLSLVTLHKMGLVALLVIATRLLLTGALHEDGLADFADGMGGGSSRERILSIMKDSHIGTYGVLALIFYFLFLYTALPHLSPLMLLTADVWGKSVASLLILQLPYARTESEAKNQTVYVRYSWWRQLVRILVAMLPVALLWWYVGEMPHPLLFLVPLAVELFLALWMKSRIGGYTGDCCGATFLLSEASMFLTFLIITPL